MAKSYAKINYTLQVLPKTHENLHKIFSIACKINLYDEITVRKNNAGKINIRCDDDDVPTDERNTVYKALTALNKYGGTKQGYNVTIVKNIPVSAGLGGGSSDAATALLCAMKLGDVHYGYNQLLEMVKGVGSDVAQFFTPGTVVIENYGEEITPIEDKLECKIVLIKPKKGVSAKEAYEAFDRFGISSEKDDSLISDLKNDNFEDAIQKMNNDLEYPVSELRPGFKKIKKEIQSFGFPFVMLSGSGSCFFALTKDEKQANDAVAYFAKKGFYAKIVEKVFE